MDWTREKPSESGTYLYRRGENKLPDVVTVQKETVIFRSGKRESIGTLRGEWGGPVEDQPPGVAGSHKLGAWGTVGLAAITAVITTFASHLVIALLSLDEPNLVHVGDKTGGTAHQKLDNTHHQISFTLSPIFRNWGFRRGHVEELKVMPQDLQPYPDEVDIQYCDKSDIGFLRSKVIECRVVVSINPKKTMPKLYRFNAAFYDANGSQLDLQYYAIEPVPKHP